MRPLRPLLITAFCLTPLTVAALELEFPSNARKAGEQTETLGSAKLPITGWMDGQMQTIWAEGEVTRQAWQIQAPGLSSLQILAPLRDQLVAEGFEVVFECDASDCGGFEFRYAIDALPEPEMHVDLGDYRYLSAQRMTSDRPEYVSLLVSRSAGRGFVQFNRIGPPLADDAALAVSTKPPIEGGSIEPAAEDDGASVLVTSMPIGDDADIVTSLEATGRAVLHDLTFETGSSQLADAAFASLNDLASWLQDHPDSRIVLVGHTDAEGTLSGNINLSRKRAAAVMERLSRAHGVAGDRMQAEGVGYLSPLTSNATDAGRTANRRVEVILSTPQ